MLALLRPFLPLGIKGLAVLAVIVGIYQAGVNAERKRGEAAALRVEIETMQADRRLGEMARESAKAKARSLEDELKRYEEELDALRKANAARPEGDVCRFSGDDLDRLYGRT